MLPTRARRQSAPKLTAEIGDVVDRVVGETDTLELLRLGVAASEPQCSAVLGYCSHNVDESALRDLGFDFRGYLYR